jgi:ADP-ribose pyrophosphatase
MEHIERINRELKYTGSILTMYKDTIKTPDGNTAEWDFIEHHGAAAVVPVTDDGKILLVRQYRNSVDRYTLEIPAGGLNLNGEEPTRIAAARELEEETGFASDNLEFLVSIVTAIAFCNEYIDIYVARDLKKTQQHLDEDEYIDVESYTPQEVRDMIYSGKIRDSKTVAAIMAYLNEQ